MMPCWQEDLRKISGVLWQTLLHLIDLNLLLDPRGAAAVAFATAAGSSD
jgi:hypothetical protein